MNLSLSHRGFSLSPPLPPTLSQSQPSNYPGGRINSNSNSRPTAGRGFAERLLGSWRTALRSGRGLAPPRWRSFQGSRPAGGRRRAQRPSWGLPAAGGAAGQPGVRGARGPGVACSLKPSRNPGRSRPQGFLLRGWLALTAGTPAPGLWPIWARGSEGVGGEGCAQARAPRHVGFALLSNPPLPLRFLTLP